MGLFYSCQNKCYQEIKFEEFKLKSDMEIYKECEHNIEYGLTNKKLDKISQYKSLSLIYI